MPKPKNKKFRILYIFPQEVGKPSKYILTSILRISNFLKSKNKEIPIPIKEKYLDLRFERLPNYIPKNLDLYRKKLKELLKSLNYKFPFDLVAISCYTSFEYLNSIEVASMIKFFINPNSLIVVGGYHPTFYPEDFHFPNIPKYFYEYYPQEIVPFDFIIQGEGEIPFFKLVKKLTSSSNKPPKKCVLLKKEIIQNLDSLPLINFDLFKKYQNNLHHINIDFTRGCIFRCTICLNSTNIIPYYNRIRYKSINKCIDELKVIQKTKWLKNKGIFISDPIFFQKKSYRKIFFSQFEQLKRNKKGFPFEIRVYDHVLLCSKEDLLSYKKLNIEPFLGFESASISMLNILEKTYNKNKANLIHYIQKTEQIIKFSSKINLSVTIDLIIGAPGETRETIQENKRFFLEKRFEGKSLIEKYNCRLYISKYKAYPFSKIYDDCESIHGGKIYYKKWWKSFLNNHRVFCRIVKPSKQLSFTKCLILNYEWLKEYISIAIKKSIKDYEKDDLKYLREGFLKLYLVYKNGINNYDSFIPEVYNKFYVYP